MSSEREQLINKLASSFGMADTYNTKYGAPKYDASTGTLYCEGISISKTTVMNALTHFERQKDYLQKISSQDPELRNQYLMNVVAYNAISMLIDNVKEK